MTLYNYDPKAVNIVWAGIPFTGFADGTFLRVEFNEDAFALSVGTDKDATRSRVNNDSGRFTVTLKQASITNQLLSALHEADKAVPTGVGIAPMMVKDNSGTSLHTAEHAWIVKSAPAEYAREPGSREWVFETEALINNVGNNLVVP